jgi:hypothetical protein
MFGNTEREKLNLVLKSNVMDAAAGGKRVGVLEQQ